MKPILLAAYSILIGCHGAAGEIKLEQIISREDPAFRCEQARLCAGRDGRVYLASSGTPSYVMRLDRDGRGKVGATVGYALTGVAANADGVLATSNAHYSHRVALHDKTFKDVVSVDDFLVNDQVGWDAPGHVEAGARDFFGLDQHRDRIVRLDQFGKFLRSYPIPRVPEGSPGLVQDFRVCEKREAFYLLARSGPLRCVGFDGKVRWSVKTEVTWDEELDNGGFEVDDNGTLYALGPRGQKVLRFAAADRNPLAPIPMQLDDIKSELPEHPFCDLRVHGGDLLVRRKHAFELYRRYDLVSGSRRQAVDADHERLTAVSDRHLDRRGVRAAPRPPGVDRRNIWTEMARLGSYGRGARLGTVQPSAQGTGPGLVSAVASPYRNVGSYPPISLSNVDEVDLQAQWEQVALPYHAAHSVDYYKRPGKPAWIHPEVWNDAGTGDLIVPTLFQALMRGADGVGASGAIPSWIQQTGGIRLTRDYRIRT